jgi:hypothetical protein
MVYWKCHRKNINAFPPLVNHLDIVKMIDDELPTILEIVRLFADEDMSYKRLREEVLDSKEEL